MSVFLDKATHSIITEKQEDSLNKIELPTLFACQQMKSLLQCKYVSSILRQYIQIIY